MAANTDFRALRERHDAMLADYRSRDWYRALGRLNNCAAAAPELEGLYDLYRGRIEGYMDSAPSDEWDGTYVAIKK
jgi:adenylate cyclase